MPEVTRSPVVTAVLVVLVFGVGMNTAYADLFGFDLGPLGAIAAEAADEIVQLTDMLSTVQKEYEEAKKIAGYADDAVQAYNAFQNLGKSLFSGNLVSSLDSMFPEVAYWQNQVSGTGPWAQGTGELQRLIIGCFTNSACFQTKGAITLNDAKTAVAGTFGTVPPVAGAIEITAMDHEAAVGMAAASAQEGRDAVARTQAKALLDKCTNAGTSNDNLAACQAAAGTAGILQAQQTADLNDALSEQNRLEAVRVAQENARRKREILDAVERRLAVLDGLKALIPPPAQVTTEGLPMNVTGGGQ